MVFLAYRSCISVQQWHPVASPAALAPEPHSTSPGTCLCPSEKAERRSVSGRHAPNWEWGELCRKWNNGMVGYMKPKYTERSILHFFFLLVFNSIMFDWRCLCVPLRIEDILYFVYKYVKYSLLSLDSCAAVRLETVSENYTTGWNWVLSGFINHLELQTAFHALKSQSPAFLQYM